jgi:hypothetical protein
VYSDTPMAGLATEAAHFGVPCVVAGYYASMVERDVPADQLPPTLFVRPDELTDAIELLIRDEAARRQLGERAQRFVKERWTAPQVAARYVALSQRADPPAWRWTPSRQAYALGWGVPEGVLATTIKRLIEYGGGPSVLRIDHLPQVRDELLQLAGERS